LLEGIPYVLTESRLLRGMPEPPPRGLVFRKQYPGRKRRIILAQELCTQRALQYQWPNFDAEFLTSAQLTCGLLRDGNQE
jgi:hypothetical protein